MTIPPQIYRLLLPALLALGPAGLAYGTPGASIYQQKCALCHGENGGGVAGLYEGPLYGDLSIEKLTQRIAETMPEDDPDSCVGEEARLVAQYIHGEFYSEAARLAKGLIEKPRIELTRLTVEQHRSAVADLIGYFAQPWADYAEPGQGGLTGKYYQSDGMSKTDKLRFERVDARIDFDFAEAGPRNDSENETNESGEPTKVEISPEQFAIVWRGNIRAAETGWHEFRVSTENGARLYVNPLHVERAGKLRDDDSGEGEKALIDAWVSSGEMRSTTGRLFLIGGRRYPIRLEFFKYKDKTASVKLEWKPPHQVWSLPGGDDLGTAHYERTFVVDAPFPADDRSVGYERGSSISTEWHDAVTKVALLAADEVVNRLPVLANVRKELKRGEEEKFLRKLKQFAQQFASVAYRRPLSEAEQTLFGETLFRSAETPELAIRQAVLLALTSPHFLYADLSPADQPPSQHTVAARLALVLWDSLPDKTLRDAADKGELKEAGQIAWHAERMIENHRTQSKVHGFFRHWLELEERDLSKDRERFPEFDEAVIASLRESVQHFVEQIVWSDSSDYRQLLLASHLPLDARLQPLYGPEQSEQAKQPQQGHFINFEFDPAQRSGILTHPYLLSAFAYHNNTSPIHRGVFLTRNIVGRSLKPPPIAVAFKESDFPADLSMREKVTMLTRDSACMSCHEAINPLGFALENYDAVGRWRTQENEKPIDPRGNYVAGDGQTHVFESARDIAEFAVASPSAQQAFVRQVFQHLVKQSPEAYGPNTVASLREDFASNDYNMKQLMIDIARFVSQHEAAVP